MAEYEMFKTTLMGGYDKEEVQEQIQKLKDEMAESQENYKKQLADKDARIAELQKRIELKEDYQARLEEDIREKNTRSILTTTRASQSWSLKLRLRQIPWKERRRKNVKKCFRMQKKKPDVK